MMPRHKMCLWSRGPKSPCDSTSQWSRDERGKTKQRRKLFPTLSIDLAAPHFSQSKRHRHQHPAGTSDMKSNSFWPSQSSGSSLARSKPNSTTSDMSTSSSTGSKSMSPPAAPPWFPTLMAMAPVAPRLTGGTRSWLPPPSAEVPKPLGPPPAAWCPPAAPARFW